MTAESELNDFIAKFAPEMRDRIRSARAAMQSRFPDAVQLVYDNDNFLVIGFGPTSRPTTSTGTEVSALLDAALDLARVPMAASEGGELIIRSVSAKQRPRR